MSSKATCPYCQAPLNVTDTVGGQPAICPHCLTNIANPLMNPAGEAPNVLRNIRRDGWSLRWWLWGLIAVCVIGVLFCYLLAQTDRSLGTAIFAAFGMTGLFLLLGILVCLAIIQPFWRWLTGEQQGHSLSGGQFVALVAMTLALGLSILAFFFGVCTALVRQL